MADPSRAEIASHHDTKPRKRQRTEYHASASKSRKEPVEKSNNEYHDTWKRHKISQRYQSPRDAPVRTTRDPWRPSLQVNNPPDLQNEYHDEDENDIFNQQGGPQKQNHKSTRSRKENPSSKIHSLRNLLRRKTLPPPVQAEKERELSALIFEREKKKLKQEHKRNLERYHFIRFMEKQKAQRTIKSLRKRQAMGYEQDGNGRDLKERLEEAQIDLNYTVYAPLGEKYISIFAEQRKGTQVSKAEKYKGNWKLFTPDERKFMDENQVNELQKESMEAANVLEIFGNVPDDGSKTGHPEIAKPPMWFEIKAAMEQGEGKLETLRDRMGGSKKGQDLVVGLTASKGNGPKRKMDWLHDNGEIDPADLDTESDEDMAGADSRSKAASIRESATEQQDAEDEDMSDGDGGFFEKR